MGTLNIHLDTVLIQINIYTILLLVYGPYSDEVGLPIHNIPSHFFLLWMSSLSLSSSSISAFTFSNHVFLGLTNGLLPSSTYIFQPVHIIYPPLMSIPSQPATSNKSCKRLNSYKISQFLTSPSVFYGNDTYVHENNKQQWT